jgi:hypothetical protein
MMDAMTAEFNADPRRMCASGFSLGGSMMYDLFCHLGDRFAGIGAIAANMWEWTYSACDPAAPTAFIHILGTSDFYAPYNGNKYSISVSQQNAYLVSVNGAETTSIDTPLDGNVTEILFPQGEGCHTVVHYRRQGGGHDVPSFATAAIWDDVSQFDIDGFIECEDVRPPVNDDCTEALEVSPGNITFSTVGATDSGIPSALFCIATNGPEVTSDVWFYVVAPCTGTFTISTCGTDFDSRIDVFDGGSGCPNPGNSPFACGDQECGDDASASSLTIEGQLLLVRVGSPDGSTGNGILQIDCEPLNPPNPADFNGDGIVDSADLGLLLAGWGTIQGDLNGDGTTNGIDIGELLSQWS